MFIIIIVVLFIFVLINGMVVYIGKLFIGKLIIKYLSKMLVFYLCNIVFFFLDCFDMNMYCSYWVG